MPASYTLPTAAFDNTVKLLCIDERLLPEEFLNQRQHEEWRKLEYCQLLVSVKDKFRTLLPHYSRGFREFREYVATCVPDADHRLAILWSTTTCEVFSRLSAGGYISENNTRLLHTILLAYGGQTVSGEREDLVQLDRQREFIDLSLELEAAIAGHTVAAHLKLCVLCTAVEFGHYYKRVEGEGEVVRVLQVLRDWEHPRLLHRVARWFHPRVARQLGRLVGERETQRSPAERVYLSHLESYVDLLMDITQHLLASPEIFTALIECVSSLRISTRYSSLKLIQQNASSVCDALLSILPFISYHNTSLLTNLTNNLTAHPALSKALLDKTTLWRNFADNTAVCGVYNVQLDSLPLDLTQRGIAILTVHVAGQIWQQPSIQTALSLVQATAKEFRLFPWSVVYLRTILTGSETGRKGDCKVEMLLPALAACILLREGEERQHHWRTHYLEILVEGACYLNGDLIEDQNCINHMHQRALAHKFFAPYFEELNNSS